MCKLCKNILLYQQFKAEHKNEVKCRYNEAMLVDESCSGLYDLQTRDGKGGGARR